MLRHVLSQFMLIMVFISWARVMPRIFIWSTSMVFRSSWLVLALGLVWYSLHLALFTFAPDDFSKCLMSWKVLRTPCSVFVVTCVGQGFDCGVVCHSYGGYAIVVVQRIDQGLE